MTVVMEVVEAMGTCNESITIFQIQPIVTDNRLMRNAIVSQCIPLS